MSGEREQPDVPSVPDAVDRPRIGVDTWVAEAEERTAYQGWAGRVGHVLDRVPRPLIFAIFTAAVAVLPLLTSNDYVIRVGFDTLIFMLLALGLNIVVGWAGLLDLGYVAFFGFGAYCYAWLSSDKFDVHWPAWATLPIVVLASLVLGFLVGLPSRRLVGDYLAIVTLFFGQLFVTVMLNGNRISLLGFTGAHDVTGGPNGIANLDPFNVFGWALPESNIGGYFYVTLIMFTVVIGVLYLLNDSRIGRAWRALREDPLAAELMGMPVNRLKLLAFALGAGTAGLTGTVFAAVHTGVFAEDFNVPILITLYAMVILGGAGSLAGAVAGAIVINVSLELLRPTNYPRQIFYGVIVLLLLTRLRPRRWLAAVAAGTVAFGIGVHALVASQWSPGTKGSAQEAGVLTWPIEHWVLLPTKAIRFGGHAITPDQLGNIAFVALVAAVIVLTLLKDWTRRLALIPVLYLAAFVWENRLIEEPSVTRLILLGALLVVLMNARPQGLFGTARVEIA